MRLASPVDNITGFQGTVLRENITKNMQCLRICKILKWGRENIGSILVKDL